MPPPLASGSLIKGGVAGNLRIGGQIVTAGYLNGEWIYQPTMTGDHVAFHLEAPSLRPWIERVPGSTAQCLWTLEDGKVMEVEYIMTDPQNWKGEWRSTNRFGRQDYTDVNESNCILAYNDNLPGTDRGSERAAERGEADIEGASGDE